MVVRKIFYVMTGLCILLLFACGPKVVAPEAELDTPGHHVNNGYKLLKTGKLDAALREFNRARELDPKHSPAYMGLGLVHGFKGEYDDGFKAMKKADKYAEGKEQKAAVNVGFMRLYIMGADRVTTNWLAEVESRFNTSIGYVRDLPDPYFYMGVAYKNSYKLQPAAAQFVKVLELGKEFVQEA
ncbi:MAG: hypothetical protein KKH68_05370, partial [Proteobacteria bacterium]|nr:hypothetical protein [Pseudomonadota bacterium]